MFFPSDATVIVLFWINSPTCKIHKSMNSFKLLFAYNINSIPTNIINDVNNVFIIFFSDALLTYNSYNMYEIK